MMTLVSVLVSMSWVAGADAPQQVAYPAYASYVVGGVPNLVVVYGAINAFGGMTRANQWYDPATDTWTTRALAPAPARYDATAAVQTRAGTTRVYVYGGSDGASSFTAAPEFTPPSNVWAARAAMPYDPEGAAASEGPAGYNYVMCGSSLNTFAMFNDNYRHDPTPDAYLARTPAPMALVDAALERAVNDVGDTCLYLIGGSSDNFSYVPSNGVYEYNPATNAWRTRAPMPTARGGVVLANLRNKIYAMGGTNSGFNSLATVEVFDPVANAWTTGPALPAGRDGGAGAAPDLMPSPVTLIAPINGDTYSLDTCYLPWNGFDWTDGVRPGKVVYATGGSGLSTTRTTWQLRADITYTVRWALNPALSPYSEAGGLLVSNYNTALTAGLQYWWSVAVVTEMSDTVWSDTQMFWLLDCPSGIGNDESGATLTKTPRFDGGALHLTLAKATRVTVSLYALDGSLVSRALDARLGAGEHVVPVATPRNRVSLLVVKEDDRMTLSLPVTGR